MSPRQADPSVLEQVTAALQKVQDPCAMALKTDWSVVDLGLLVDAYEAGDGELVVELTLTDPLCPFLETLDEMIVEAVTAETDYAKVTVDISSTVAWDPSRLRARADDPNAARP